MVNIMAPVGCWESLAAAIHAGATSVYFGIEHLNMRARSSVNFTTEDLHTIVATCREAGVNQPLDQEMLAVRQRVFQKLL